MARYILVAVATKTDVDPVIHKRVCGNFVEWVRSSHPNLEVLPVDFRDQEFVLEHTLEVAGVVFSGGCDVNPALYHQAREPHTNEPNDARDHFELWLFSQAQVHHWAVLGICRGLQLISVALGGALVQHIGESHTCISLEQDRYHALSVEPGTKLHNLLGVDTTEINSSHHQAVDTVHIGTQLRVAAWSKLPDGADIIEALESLDASWPWFMLVQWHPERIPESLSSRALLAAFIAHCA